MSEFLVVVNNYSCKKNSGIEKYYLIFTEKKNTVQGRLTDSPECTEKFVSDMRCHLPNIQHTLGLGEATA